jgi:hypothetical protein
MRGKRRRPEDVIDLGLACKAAKAAGCELAVMNYNRPMHLRIIGESGAKVDYWPVSGTMWCVNNGTAAQKKKTLADAIAMASAPGRGIARQRGVCTIGIAEARSIASAMQLGVEALTDQHPAHWRISVPGGVRVDYWPGRGTWSQVGTKVYVKGQVPFERVLEIAREIASSKSSKPALTLGQ